jgi:glycosyltransferase involved in cell wall biosynthesis
MKKKILFIYTNYSTFVKTDFEILSSEHEVAKYQFKPVKGLIKTAVQFIKQKIFLLLNIWKFDAVFIWFADYHSFLPVLFAKFFKKKSFVVIGGYDVARMPEYQYGSFHGQLRSFCTLFSMKYSTLNLAVSQYVERKVKWIAKNANTQLIYNCVNIAENPEIRVEKENLIVTVGLIDSGRTYYLKGIDTFIEIARLLPEYKFMAIGMSYVLPEDIANNLPKNLGFVERVDHNALESYYKKAKVYCQLSRTESFGVAIVEAMNFGCIPVVTNVGGMPELVAGTGKIVKRDAGYISALLVESITQYESVSFDNDFKHGIFSVQARKEKILSIIG